MSSKQPRIREGAHHRPENESFLRAWSRWSGIVVTVVTFISMVQSAEWKFWLVLTDPLAWMTLLLAAAGVVAGYALGCRVHAKRVAA
jgi:hypothetical protein